MTAMTWARSKNATDDLFLGQPIYTSGVWEIRSESEWSAWSIFGRSKGVGSTKTVFNIYKAGDDIGCPCPTLKEAKEFVLYRIVVDANRGR